MFMESLKKLLDESFNESVTENGAIGYKTSGKELVDLNFAISSMRNMSEDEIIQKFVKAFYENKVLAVKWLFFARDVREGVGERRLFRICMRYLVEKHERIAKAVLPLIPEYGRYDDWFVFFDSELEDKMIELAARQLLEDIDNMKANKPISLLAKWMPSINTSSDESKKRARKIIQKLEITERKYRKMLSELRAYLKVVEVSMSKKEWKAIDYSQVPSRANLIYNDAFLRNDEQRRRLFLGNLQKGETKINSGVLFPHEIVHDYNSKCCEDTALEEMWKALPDYVKDAGNTICVADGSGSMSVKVGGTKVSALTVANALAIYFAERSSGQFKDTYITFSETPQLVNLSNGSSLIEKIEIALKYCEIANTNIEAVFDLILETAVRNKMKQSDMPKNILILSDMEFDRCAGISGDFNDTDYWGRPRLRKPDKKFFKMIAEKYAAYGYSLPRLVFWNIASRTGTIPVKENDLGVALVSGFSPTVMKMVLSNKTDPFECLLEQLNCERYEAVEKVLIEIC